MSMKFEYDPHKSTANKTKHGIDFEEAQELWQDHRAVIIDLPKGHQESRSIVIGALRGRMWTAVITYRGGTVRLISVRRSREKEVAIYDSYTHQQ